MRVKGSDPTTLAVAPQAKPLEKSAPAPAAPAPAAGAPSWGAGARTVSAISRPPLPPSASPAEQLTAQHFLALRGDAPRTLAGAALTNELGAAMQLAPNHVPTTSEQAAALEQGSWPFYSGKPGEAVQTVAESISKLAGGTSPVRVATLPLTFTDPKTQRSIYVPLFRVDNADGTTRGFVDTSGRQYQNFAQWKSDNRLPPGKVAYPANGHLQSRGDGQPMLSSEATHSTIDTPLEHLENWAEKAGMVAGFVVGGAALIGVGGIAVPIAGAALALGFGGKAVAGLVDAARHGESLNPFKSAEARGNWLTAGASVAGLGAGTAAATAARELASVGEVASVAGRAAPALTVGAEALGAAQTASGAADLARNWDSMSPKDRMLAASQLVFFGALSAKSAHEAGGFDKLYSLSAAKERIEAAARPVVKREQQAEALTPEKALASLKKLEGFGAVEQRQLDVMFNGANVRSKRAQAGLAELLGKDSFLEATPEAKLGQLRKTYQASAPDLVSFDVSSKLKAVQLKSTTVGEPKQVARFNWEIAGYSRAPAVRTDVTVRGHTVPVYAPPDGKFFNGSKKLVSHSVQDITDALSMMPPEALERVKEIRLSAVPNPQDAHWAKLYDDPDMASYMTCGTDGVVTVFPWKADAGSSPKDLATNMMHEMGHQWSLTDWGENFSRGRSAAWTKWNEAMKADGISPSNYADSDIAEDVAESSALRASLLHHPELLAEYRQLFPHRMAILDERFGTP